jgi:hypothetical protein
MLPESLEQLAEGMSSISAGESVQQQPVAHGVALSGALVVFNEFSGDWKEQNRSGSSRTVGTIG